MPACGARALAAKAVHESPWHHAGIIYTKDKVVVYYMVYLQQLSKQPDLNNGLCVDLWMACLTHSNNCDVPSEIEATYIHWLRCLRPVDRPCMALTVKAFAARCSSSRPVRDISCSAGTHSSLVASGQADSSSSSKR